MAEVIVALVSIAVQVVLEKTVSRDFVDFVSSKKLDDSLLRKLKTTLLSLRAMVNDADVKHITNDDVKEWLRMLSNAVFEADDLFDEINTQALRSKVKAQHQTKVQNFLSSPFRRSYGDINSKMQTLYGELEILRKTGKNIGLKAVSSSFQHGTLPGSGLKTISNAVLGLCAWIEAHI